MREVSTLANSVKNQGSNLIENFTINITEHGPWEFYKALQTGAL